MNSSDRTLLESKMHERPHFVPESDYRSRDSSAPAALVARAEFPTAFGEFDIVGIYDPSSGQELCALVRGEVQGQHDVPVRLHSQCQTGDVFASLRCDCQAQLHAAMEYIGRHEVGVVVYLPQEGRGIGLLNKITAYHLQDLGLDTCEANEYLGYPADARTYDLATRVLRALGVESVSLLTNNPEKMRSVQRAGLRLTRRIPLVAPENPHNADYLATKRTRLGHLL